MEAAEHESVDEKTADESGKEESAEGDGPFFDKPKISTNATELRLMAVVHYQKVPSSIAGLIYIHVHTYKCLHVYWA